MLASVPCDVYTDSALCFLASFLTFHQRVLKLFILFSSRFFTRVAAVGFCLPGLHLRFDSLFLSRGSIQFSYLSACELGLLPLLVHMY